jgi:hypothetical protein
VPDSVKIYHLRNVEIVNIEVIAQCDLVRIVLLSVGCQKLVSISKGAVAAIC